MDTKILVLRLPYIQRRRMKWTLHVGQHKGERDEGIARLKRDGTRAETRFRLSPKRTSPFKPASVQSTAGSRGVRISGSNAGYTSFGGSVRVLATHSIRQFPLHFPSRASPCAIRFQTHYIFLHPMEGVRAGEGKATKKATAVYGNSEVLSHNHHCHGKEISVKY